ncbi:uncharacterized protein LOC127258440 [Andrographis paniculata]|uniref:uncharacterized protein LOC127258440 n=1 Tax=Andrographis paniculata TaxID=175694 RepID=UPI0021E8546E|nr:uncharacterized protein LOC127258440 [Andrographis paniculata]
MENCEGDEDKCPSFSSYSSNRLAEVATKVAAEEEESNRGGDDGDDFEFALVREDDKDVLSAESFYEGRIGSVFPVFNRDPSRKDDGGFSSNKRLDPNITVPLRKLLMEDRELHSCEGDNPQSPSSSDDADYLENTSPGATYRVLQPKAADKPPSSRCKNSNSTGSVLRRWNICDFLRRSNSEGKDGFAILTPKLRREKSLQIEALEKTKGTNAAAAAASAHEVLYIRNRATKDEDKKKSYLPYRRDIVGFFRQR